MPWLMRFVGNAGESTRMKNAHAMASLMKGTLSAYSRVLEGSAAGQYVRRLGSLDVYKNRSTFDAGAGGEGAVFGLWVRP